MNVCRVRTVENGVEADGIDIQRETIRIAEDVIPSVLLIPPNPLGAAVVLHGYGGSKEEPLGLAWRVAEMGLVACSIDLRGHGENILPLSRDVLYDVDFVVSRCRRFGKVVSIGHSLGGRLALLSKADFCLAISPALNQMFSEQTQEVVRENRSYRVHEESPGTVFEVLKELPNYHHDENRPVRIVFGSRDVPEIVKSCTELNASNVPVIEIEGALHSDTFLLPALFKEVGKSIAEWFH